MSVLGYSVGEGGEEKKKTKGAGRSAGGGGQASGEAKGAGQDRARQARTPPRGRRGGRAEKKKNPAGG